MRSKHEESERAQGSDRFRGGVVLNNPDEIEAIDSDIEAYLRVRTCGGGLKELDGSRYFVLAELPLSINDDLGDEEDLDEDDDMPAEESTGLSDYEFCFIVLWFEIDAHAFKSVLRSIDEEGPKTLTFKGKLATRLSIFPATFGRVCRLRLRTYGAVPLVDFDDDEECALALALTRGVSPEEWGDLVEELTEVAHKRPRGEIASLNRRPRQ